MAFYFHYLWFSNSKILVPPLLIFSCHCLLFQVVCKPGTLKTYTKFEAEIYVLTKDEGGRHTAFMSNYSPQFYFRTADVTGKIELLGDMKMVLPGDNVTANFELILPVPLEQGRNYVSTSLNLSWI